METTGQRADGSSCARSGARRSPPPSERPRVSLAASRARARIPSQPSSGSCARAKITNEQGEVVFEQTDVEMPKSWSQLATNVVVSKYFRGHVGTPERERSVKQLIGRVVGRIREWGERRATSARRRTRRPSPDELTHLLRDAAHGLQQPRLVQPRRARTRRSRRAPASSTPSRTRWSRSWTSRRPRRCSSRAARARARTSRASAPRASGSRGGGTASRPGLVHARLRRLRGRGQVGRQDPPRRQDGDPERRPPRHPGVHPLQGGRGEEGLVADRRPATTAASTCRAAPTTPSSTRTPITPCA